MILEQVHKLKRKCLCDNIHPDFLELHIDEGLYSQMIGELSESEGVIIIDRILGMKIKICEKGLEVKESEFRKQLRKSTVNTG